MGEPLPRTGMLLGNNCFFFETAKPKKPPDFTPSGVSLSFEIQRLTLKKHASLSFATFDPTASSDGAPTQLQNLVEGQWVASRESRDVLDPLTGNVMLRVPYTQPDEFAPFVASLAKCPKSGLHNPFKNVERYLLYGAVSARAARGLRTEEVADFFTRCIQRVMPKSYAQARGEVDVVATFFENFSGDQVRFLARGFSNPGNHLGQRSHGFRWPYGPVAIISPFNFPLEIPVLQLMGALYMGNKVVIKNSTSTCLVIEQFLRFLHTCGLPKEDVDLIHTGGREMGVLLEQAPLRSVQFTGSSSVAEHLSRELRGKVYIEDAGFDWKILGADASPEWLDYVAWQCDQDAYAASGQKCSAQSILFAHTHWVQAGLFQKLQNRAAMRHLEDLTIGPVLTICNDLIQQHIDRILAIPGASLAFGGKPLQGHTIPARYGAYEPTAVFVPLEQILQPQYFSIVCSELFGPFQILTEWKDSQLDLLLEACERMEHHLTAAVVSNDVHFLQTVLGHTVNGTTYAGLRARTTGAPQNHWFGPAGDPRGAGIGTPEAIQLVWSCHREIIEDLGPLPPSWSPPKPS